VDQRNSNPAGSRVTVRSEVHEAQEKTFDSPGAGEGAIEKSDGGRVLTVTQPRSPLRFPFRARGCR